MSRFSHHYRKFNDDGVIKELLGLNMALKVKVLKWLNDNRKIVLTATKLAVIALIATAAETLAQDPGATIQNRELDDEWT